MMPARVTDGRTLDDAEVARWLAAVGRAPGGAWPVAWIPAPRAELGQVVAAVGRDADVAWHDPDGFGCVGFGTAALVTASGSERFAAVERALDERLRETTSVALTDGAPPPRMFGGFAFQPGSADADEWRGFGDARFVLPRIAYVATPAGAWLGLASQATESNRERVAAGERLVEIARALAAPRPPRGARAGRPPLGPFDDRALLARLELARAAIERGELEKVVIAHRLLLHLQPRPDVAEVLEGLIADNPSATTFAFRVDDGCFLGATPERLVTRSGRSITAEALAGSALRDPAAARDALLVSDKDLAEHRFVVRAIAEALGPLTASLEIPARPVLRELSNVVHLRTPIAGSLRRPLHVVELVARLHPTPAVGGTPTAAALAWLAAHEPAPRGWYAAPVGWVDGTGDGNFVVALRSGLLGGERAELHAGAGVVADSDPAAEVAEIRLKLATFLAALGVTGR